MPWSVDCLLPLISIIALAPSYTPFICKISIVTYVAVTLQLCDTHLHYSPLTCVYLTNVWEPAKFSPKIDVGGCFAYSLRFVRWTQMLSHVDSVNYYDMSLTLNYI